MQRGEEVCVVLQATVPSAAARTSTVEKEQNVALGRSVGNLRTIVAPCASGNKLSEFYNPVLPEPQASVQYNDANNSF